MRRAGCLHSPPSSILGHREHISCSDGLSWGSNQDYLRALFSSGLTWSPEFCRRLLGPSALFSGGVLQSPRQGNACLCLFLLLENSLTPCIIPALLQIGCPKPLALLQTDIARPPGQVKRPGEESQICWWGGKRLLPALWRLR